MEFYQGNNRMQPKISVLMPVYNGNRYLRESIDSILNQTFTDFELIIIDDGSTDSTWEILSEYADQDQRVRLFKNEENIGLINSLNKGLNLAKGNYIARQDADDVSLPKRFEKQIAVLDKHQKVILVSCDIEIINSEGTLLGKLQRACDPKLVAWYLIFHNRIAGHSQVMFRRKPVLNLGGYSQINSYSEDYELWCRLAKVDDIIILPEVLLQQRMHSKSLCAERGTDQNVWSLTQSKNNIEQLIGKELSLEEVENLRKFWTVHESRKSFPDSCSAGTLHSRLKEIYQAFLQQATHQNLSYPKSHQLRILIGKQFICWISFLRIRYNLLAKLKISVYAFAWFPTGVIEYWLNKFWNLQVRILRVLLRLPHNRKFQGNS